MFSLAKRNVIVAVIGVAVFLITVVSCGLLSSGGSKQQPTPRPTDSASTSSAPSPTNSPEDPSHHVLADNATTKVVGGAGCRYALTFVNGRPVWMNRDSEDPSVDTTAPTQYEANFCNGQSVLRGLYANRPVEVSGTPDRDGCNDDVEKAFQQDPASPKSVQFSTLHAGTTLCFTTSGTLVGRLTMVTPPAPISGSAGSTDPGTWTYSAWGSPTELAQ